MLASSYLVTLVTSSSQFNFLCEIPHFEPGLSIEIHKDRQQSCVFSKRQKGTQSTGEVETVVNSSLTPVTSLLVPLTCPTDLVCVVQQGMNHDEHYFQTSLV